MSAASTRSRPCATPPSTIRRGRRADEQRRTAPGGGPWEHIDRWRRVLEVNLWGVINGVQTFTPPMLAQGTECAIVNTGSKQGITCPPGDTAYNVSKAGVKVLTEALAHSLRNEEGARITAHLLIPGSTFTAMTRRRTYREAAGRLDAGSGRGHADRRDEPARFLHPLPRQRGDARRSTIAGSCGPRRTSPEPPGAVALAPGLHRRVRSIPERITATTAEARRLESLFRPPFTFREIPS